MHERTLIRHVCALSMYLRISELAASDTVDPKNESFYYEIVMATGGLLP